MAVLWFGMDKSVSTANLLSPITFLFGVFSFGTFSACRNTETNDMSLSDRYFRKARKADNLTLQVAGLQLRTFFIQTIHSSMFFLQKQSAFNVSGVMPFTVLRNSA
jgi:hypothetical protein